MPLTPEDVSNKRFTAVRLREGYDMGEDDQFLDEVELTRLVTENDELRAKVEALQSGKPVPETPAPEESSEQPEEPEEQPEEQAPEQAEEPAQEAAPEPQPEPEPEPEPAREEAP